MILISFIHITNTERNITRKVGESCYKKYRVYLCSYNTGIMIYTIATLLTIVHDFFRLSKKYTWNGTWLVSCRLFQIIIYEPTKQFKNYDICHLVRR